MIDFKKLTDPEFIAEQDAKRQKAEEGRVAADKKRDEAIQLCHANESKLSARELTFLRSVENGIYIYSRQLSEKQLKWLFDISARLAPKEFITITHGMRGYFAVLIGTDEEGFQCPHNTGIGSYKTREAATPEAKEWAEAEGIPFVSH